VNYRFCLFCYKSTTFPVPAKQNLPEKCLVRRLPRMRTVRHAMVLGARVRAEALRSSRFCSVNYKFVPPGTRYSSATQAILRCTPCGCNKFNRRFAYRRTSAPIFLTTPCGLHSWYPSLFVLSALSKNAIILLFTCATALTPYLRAARSVNSHRLHECCIFPLVSALSLRIKKIL
jgi:hypothetical protein